ncbi:UNVERIFIED_CONTAM: hypothetical protein FKN15_053943 [Acipenser sinensis]
MMFLSDYLSPFHTGTPTRVRTRVLATQVAIPAQQIASGEPPVPVPYRALTCRMCQWRTTRTRTVPSPHVSDVPVENRPYPYRTEPSRVGCANGEGVKARAHFGLFSLAIFLLIETQHEPEDEETFALINIWAYGSIQRSLDGSIRNKLFPGH